VTRWNAGDRKPYEMKLLGAGFLLAQLRAFFALPLPTLSGSTVYIYTLNQPHGSFSACVTAATTAQLKDLCASCKADGGVDVENHRGWGETYRSLESPLG